MQIAEAITQTIIQQDMIIQITASMSLELHRRLLRRVNAQFPLIPAIIIQCRSKDQLTTPIIANTTLTMTRKFTRTTHLVLTEVLNTAIVKDSIYHAATRYHHPHTPTNTSTGNIWMATTKSGT